jgi:hypothetical protein
MLDPKDPSHCTVDYDFGGQRGSIDVYSPTTTSSASCPKPVVSPGKLGRRRAPPLRPANRSSARPRNPRLNTAVKVTLTRPINTPASQAVAAYQAPPRPRR